MYVYARNNKNNNNKNGNDNNKRRKYEYMRPVERQQNKLILVTILSIS